MPESSPLLEAFFRLRGRRFPLGVQEYLNALRAISLGYGLGSRKRLIFLCQTLWAKSPEEQRQVEDIFKAVLPPTLSEDEVEKYLREIESEAARLTEEGLPGPPPSPPDAKPAPTLPGKAPVQPPRGGGAALAAAQPRVRLEPAQQPSPTEPMEIDLPPPPFRDWKYNPNLDFVGQLPIAKRQMKNAWRYLRRMQRTGQRVELDVAHTIEQTYKDGILLEPVLMPRRTNQARLLILVDEGGSMVPFRRTTRALLDSAQHGGLRQVAVYYFHDVPLQYLFSHPQMSRNCAEKIEVVLEKFRGAGVLILSDGGAARGKLEDSRATQMTGFLRKLRECRFNVAWLNPAPEDRWAGTTAEQVCDASDVRMESYSREGFGSLILALRGKT